MAYSQHIYDLANSTMRKRRADALSLAEQRKNTFFLQFPRLAEIESELNSIGIATARAVLSGEDVVLQLNSLKEKSCTLQKEFAEILTSNGYPKDHLEPKFTCDICCDMGVVERDNMTLTCSCFKKLLSDTACDELNKISPLSLSTFDSFDLSYYSDSLDENGKNPYKRMLKIYNYCQNYAETFSKNSRGLFMSGGTGLGKTHLSLAIANEVIKKGFSVVYVSVPDILSKLEREHFSYEKSREDEIMQSLLKCDLLILDDLGTEFITQFASTTIYNIFNSRVTANRPVIINTNLADTELEKIYSERFLSRVMGSCDQLDFIGKDIRARL